LNTATSYNFSFLDYTQGHVNHTLGYKRDNCPDRLANKSWLKVLLADLL